MSLFFFIIMNKLYLKPEDISYLNKISLTDLPILVTGSNGVGKNFIGEYIHHHSTRKRNPFVEIDLTTIPLDLIEKELYGAVKGSFTGLENEYKGKFSNANYGTVLLNGIDEIPKEYQGKLLQVLDKGIYYPIGSNDPLKCDVRVISISSSTIGELSIKDSFRKDLLYRINTFHYHVPDLKDRMDFIKSIVDDRLDEISNGSEVVGYDSLLPLYKNHWRGNIRELLNCIDRVFTLRVGNEITFDSLLLSSNNTVNITSKKLKDAVIDFKKQFIADALERNSGNITNCAKELGVQRTYLSRLIKELRIVRG